MDTTKDMSSSPDRGSAKPIVLTAAYYSSLALLGLATAAAGPSLPTLASHTTSSLDRISLFFVADAFGYLLGSLTGGRLYDRLPGHRLMAGMLLLMSVAAVGIPLASVLWLLLLLGFLLGLGKGAVDVGCNTLLQWVHGNRVGPFMNGLHFAFGLGSFLAPILLAQVLSLTHEIYWLFWIIAISMAPVVIWLWLLPEPHASLAGSVDDSGRAPFLPVLLMVLAFLLYVGAEVGFSNWIYTYAITLRLADAITAAYLTSAYWAFFTIGRLLGIWVSTRLSSRTILYIDFAGCLLSMALIGIAYDSVPLLWVGSMGLGLSTASIFPTFLILAGERLRVTGTVTGLFLLGGGAGSMLLPWVIGQAFTSAGPHSMLSILFLDLALGVVMLVLFIRGSRPARGPVPLTGPAT
jgi:MFS transporter, FHS family, Na+ dependent glucose transporter 1